MILVGGATRASAMASMLLFAAAVLLAGCGGFHSSSSNLITNTTQSSSNAVGTCLYSYAPTQNCQPNGTQTVNVTASYPSGCVGTPATTQNCNYVAPACTYTYTPAGSCQPNGTQTVTVASSAPTGCAGTPATTQACNYVAPACVYTYTPTENCQPNGTQTVTVASSSPTGCTGTPVTSQSCSYVPGVCVYTYTPTGSCQPNGTQTVTVASSSPVGCSGTPATTQACNYVAPACAYTYTPTQSCQPNGTQTVTVASTSPAGCSGTPMTAQSCTYVAPSCNYTYTPTESCQPNGTQTVSVASASPAGCSGTPMTTQACSYSPAPVISSFDASSVSLMFGQQTTLSWSVSNATSISVTVAGIYTPLNQGTATSLTLAPTTTTTYVLTASNSGGSVTQSVTVVVASASAGLVPLSVGSLFLNKVLVSVQVCLPNTTTCQTINNIILDTGSVGLHIYKSALTLPIPSQNTNTVLCTTYGGGSNFWGPVAELDVNLGGLTAPSVPTHIVDPSFAGGSSSCDSPAPGVNGQIGINSALFNNNGSSEFSCTGSTCTAVAVDPMVLPNPISYMPPPFNQGFAIELPTVPTQGAASIQGTLQLGLNAPSLPSSVISVRTDSFLQLLYNGNTYWTLFDTGTDTYDLPPAAVGSMPYCSGSNYYICPTSPENFTVQLLSPYATTVQKVMNVQFQNEPTPKSGAVPNLAGSWGGSTSTELVFGLPFFFGKTVYFVIAGAGDPVLGSGPLVAF